MTREDALAQKLDKKEIYNKKGVLTEYWKYEIDGTVYEKIKIAKNESGKLVKRTTFDGEGKLKSYVSTEFDEKENIIRFRTYNANDELTSMQENHYDSSGNTISRSNTSIASNKTYKTTSKYNSQNQLIEETDFNPDGLMRDIRTFKYDEKGNEFESDLTRANGDFTKFVSQYDKVNNITSQYWYDNEGNQKHWNSFSYVYDKHNNWITKKRYTNGELGYVWERKIEYN